MNHAKLLFVLTSHDTLGDSGEKTGYFLSEVSHPYHLLAQRGLEIDFASPRGGEPPVDPKSRDLEDPVNAAFLEDVSTQEKLRHSKRPDEIDPADYAAIFYAGGHGAMWDLPNNTGLARIAATIYEGGGVVSAVCHGPAGLLNIRLANGLGLIEGAQVTCFTDSEEQAVGLDGVVPFLLETRMKDGGAEHTKATGDFRAHVVVCERMVTGQNPASAKGVGEAIAALLQY